MKTNAILRIVLYSLIIILLLAILAACFGLTVYSDKTVWSTSQVSNMLDADAFTVDPTQVENLKIQWASGAIHIRTGDVSEIHVQETASAVPLVWNLSDGTLTVRFSDATFMSVSGSKDLEITVPEGWTCRKLKLEVASADVDITGFTAQNVSFDGASGKCTLTNCAIGTLDVDTASGDFRFDGTLEQMDCDAASADCVLVLKNIPEELKMDGASGNLDITLPEGSGFTVRMDGLSSSVRSDFAVTMQNGLYECGDGHCRIEVSALSGDVIIRKAS